VPGLWLPCILHVWFHYEGEDVPSAASSTVHSDRFVSMFFKINVSLSLISVYALSSRLSLGCAQWSFTGRKSTNCSCLQISHSRMSSTQHFARVIAGQNNVLDRSMGIAYPRSSQNAASGSFHTSTSGMQTPNPMFSCLDVAAVFA
jgi:hypothetical protein